MTTYVVGTTGSWAFPDPPDAERHLVDECSLSHPWIVQQVTSPTGLCGVVVGRSSLRPVGDDRLCERCKAIAAERQERT